MTDRIVTCRGADCRAQIRLVELESGNHMPVDLEPAADGRIVQLPSGKYRVLSAVTAAKLRAEDRCVPLYRSHFASCPNGPQFRNRQRSATR